MILFLLIVIALLSQVYTTFLPVPDLTTPYVENKYILGSVLDRGEKFVVYETGPTSRIKYSIDCDSVGRIEPSFFFLGKFIHEMALEEKLTKTRMHISNLLKLDRSVLEISDHPKLAFGMKKEDLDQCLDMGAELEYAVFEYLEDIRPITRITPAVSESIINLVERLHSTGIVFGNISMDSFVQDSDDEIFFDTFDEAYLTDTWDINQAASYQNYGWVSLLRLFGFSGSVYQDEIAWSALRVRRVILANEVVLLPKPNLIGNESDSGLTLGNPRGLPRPNELVFDVIGRPNLLIKYSLSDLLEDQLYTEIAAFTNRAHAAGIGLGRMSVSQVAPLPKTRIATDVKLAFAISDARYDSLYESGYGVRYAVMDIDTPVGTVRRYPLSQAGNLNTHFSGHSLEAMNICMQLCMMLEQLNKLGILHGNINPNSVWMLESSDSTNTLKIRHFGHSSLVADKRGEVYKDWIGVLEVFKSLMSVRSEPMADIDKMIDATTEEFLTSENPKAYTRIVKSALDKFMISPVPIELAPRNTRTPISPTPRKE